MAAKQRDRRAGRDAQTAILALLVVTALLVLREHWLYSGGAAAWLPLAGLVRSGQAAVQRGPAGPPTLESPAPDSAPAPAADTPAGAGAGAVAAPTAPAPAAAHATLPPATAAAAAAAPAAAAAASAGPDSAAQMLAGLNATGAVRAISVATTVPFKLFVSAVRQCKAVCYTLAAWHRFAPVESTIFEHILSHTPPEQRLVVDVGVNVGYFAMLAAAWGARVIGFEPGGQARTLAQASVAAAGLQDRVTVHPFAVGASEAVARMQSNSTDWALNQVVVGAGGATNGSAAGTFRVVRLADHVGAEQGRIRILKVDTEGFELEVFRGAFDVLPRVDYVITEIKSWRSQPKVQLMLDILRRGNFSHAYNHHERYRRNSEYPVVVTASKKVFWEVTPTLRQLAQAPGRQDLLKKLAAEDFVFCRKPLSLNVRPPTGVPRQAG